MKYLVAFKTKSDDEPFREDVVTYNKEIDCKEDIENIKKMIMEKWYVDDCEEDVNITIILFELE